jgi:hypothetical protein
MKKWYQGDKRIAKKMEVLLNGLCQEFGWTTRIFGALSGRYFYHTLKKEEKRLADGWSYEPKSFYEKNASAEALEHGSVTQANPRTSVVKRTVGELFPIFARIRAIAFDSK